MMSRSHFIYLLLILLLPSKEILAQKDSVLSKFTLLRTDWDSNYIDKYPSRWSARIYIVSKSHRFNVTDEIDQDRINFDPKGKIALGFGVSYNSFALDLGANINAVQEDDGHHTSSVDLLSNLYTGQHALDINYQWYLGFFSSYSDEESDTTISQFRDDVRTFNIGINYIYTFNFRRFSFNAPSIGTQIQKKSAGSVLAGLFFSYYDMRANTNIIPVERQPDFNDRAQFSEANLLSGGFLAGYAYTFVLPAHLFISLSLAPGLSLNVGDVKTQQYYSIGNPFTGSFKLISKNSIGYGGNKVYAFLSYNVDRNFVNMGDDNEMNYNLSKFKLLVGYRIK